MATNKKAIWGLFDLDNKEPFDEQFELFDLTAITALDKDRRAKITLHDPDLVDHYRCFVVEIVSKTHGQIDRKTFKFDDYIPPQRIDSRPDHKGPFEIIGGLGWQWYIAIPRNTRPLAKAIHQYIEQWR